MACNEEKAKSILNWFIAMKNKPKERCPHPASECRDQWCQRIMGEIGQEVAKIQNEGLSEHPF
ncbi:hypothetical protein NMG60_11012051 [Bertholletia excelsa]